MNLKLFLICFIASVYSKPLSDTIGVVYTIQIVPNEIDQNSLELTPTKNLKTKFHQSAIEELLKHVFDDVKTEGAKNEDNSLEFFDFDFLNHDFNKISKDDGNALKYEDFKRLKNLQQAAIDDVLKHVLLSKINDKDDEMVIPNNEDKDFGRIEVLRQSAIEDLLKHVLLGDADDDNVRIIDLKNEKKRFDLLKKSNFLSRLKRAAEHFQSDPPTMVDLLGYTPMRDFDGIMNKPSQDLSIVRESYTPQIQSMYPLQNPLVRKPQVPNLPMLYGRGIRQNGSNAPKPAVTNLPLIRK